MSYSFASVPSSSPLEVHMQLVFPRGLTSGFETSHTKNRFSDCILQVNRELPAVSEVQILFALYVPSKSSSKLEKSSIYFGEAIDLYHESFGQSGPVKIEKVFKIDTRQLTDQVRVSWGSRIFEENP